MILPGVSDQLLAKRAPRVRQMFASIAKRYDLTNSVLSFGIHHYWKKSFVRALPAGQGGLALDLCCGTGDLAPLLARLGYRVQSADFCGEMLAVGVQRGRLETPVQADGLQLPFPDSCFQLVTAAFGVRNFENISTGLREMLRVTAPGGAIGILEFGAPPKGIFATIFGLYSSRVMPMLGGLVTGNPEAYSYLPASANSFPAGQEFVELAERSGMKLQNLQTYSFGVCYAYRFQKGEV